MHAVYGLALAMEEATIFQDPAATCDFTFGNIHWHGFTHGFKIITIHIPLVQTDKLEDGRILSRQPLIQEVQGGKNSPAGFITRGPGKVFFQLGQQSGCGLFPKAQQDGAYGQRVTGQLLHQLQIPLIITFDVQPQVANYGITVFPLLFTNQAAQRQPEALDIGKPSLRRTTGNQDSALPAAQSF